MGDVKRRRRHQPSRRAKEARNKKIRIATIIVVAWLLTVAATLGVMLGDSRDNGFGAPASLPPPP